MEKFIEETKQRHLETIIKAKEFIGLYFLENISLREISNYCRVSPDHLSHIFKRITNYSPYQYLLLQRLKHAEYLLLTTSSSITDVCFSSGFNSHEHFTTIFRRKLKCNPSEYRKLRRGIEAFSVKLSNDSIQIISLNPNKIAKVDA